MDGFCKLNGECHDECLQEELDDLESDEANFEWECIYECESSVSSYIFDGKAFVHIPNSSEPKNYFACGLIDDQIVVVGEGLEDYEKKCTSSEYFSLKTFTWSTGCLFDSSEIDGKIVSTNNITLFIGAYDIYKLTSTGEGRVEWEKVGEIENARYSFDAFIISPEECKNWETECFK